jgi:Gas vesicle synthesis protein GvpL/GvpF
MKLYAYCVVTNGAIESDMAGLYERKVHSITSGNVTALVSEFDGDIVPVAKKNVLVHQDVVRKVLETKTPLPFRFGTLVTEAQLKSYLESRQEALLRKLEAVQGCVEMSVKVIWQKSVTRESTDFSKDQTESIEGMGAAFLRKRREEIVGSQRLIEEANEIASWLRGLVEPVVRDAHFTVRPSDRLVLAADYLVEWPQLEPYRLTLQRARDERAHLHFLTSGPWPPYSFANIDLEFKTQFGVS